MPNNGGRVGRFETLESYPDESGWRQLCFVLGWAAWMAGAVYVIYMVGGIAWHTLAEIAKVLK